ncbi:MAG: B12-binding domain-containing radical SAM protein [Chloroflexi bacterium RBG_13_54_9]|nr:MAG: B12-binding domain-containing radical SAM protein [Chloroflexi bacterium RBG_13_54_9]
MKLELICPARQESGPKRKKTLLPPLGLSMIAALTPPGVEVSLTDENVSVVDFEKETDLVGITALTVTAQRAYEIADTFRARGVKVVLGGVHPSILPEEAGQHADAVVIGEAEGIWSNLIEDFKAGNLQKVYRQDERLSLVGLPIPRRDLFAEGAYYVRQTISTTRGCPYSCAFCTVTSFFGHTYRCRPVEEILKEIETLNRRKFIAFLDDNIVGNPKFAKELFRALIPYKIKWASQASVTIAKDDELLKLAAASGCIGLLIGFESLSPVNLAAVGKRINAVDEYADVIRKIHSHGIAVHGFFIFGFDEDDEGVFTRTVRFAQKMRLESASFDFLTPYPGTAFYESLDSTGRILTKDWLRYGYEIVFEPKLMSREMLQDGHYRAWRQFHSIPSIWRRVGVARRNLAALWAINLAYRGRWRGKLRANKEG